MDQSYSTSFQVDHSPEEVFAAINNVRGWWSEEIEGRTDELGEFRYHYKEMHRCTIKITELVPSTKVVWHITDNYFSFVMDKSEWKDTDILFEIARLGDKTEVRFTHVGLVPAYECYSVCSDAWGTYINGSLYDLITKGKGQPNQNEQIASQHGIVEEPPLNQDYTTSFVVEQTPHEAFAAINHVRGWWSGEVEGETGELGAVFTYRVPDVHYSQMKITELIPGQRVVWHVLDSYLSYTSAKSEWNGTNICFEISTRDGKTEVRFTHVGLVPSDECYGSCSNAWAALLNGNLLKLITTGRDQPNIFAKDA